MFRNLARGSKVLRTNHNVIKRTISQNTNDPSSIFGMAAMVAGVGGIVYFSTPMKKEASKPTQNATAQKEAKGLDLSEIKPKAKLSPEQIDEQTKPEVVTEPEVTPVAPEVETSEIESPLIEVSEVELKSNSQPEVELEPEVTNEISEVVSEPDIEPEIIPLAEEIEAVTETVAEIVEVIEEFTEAVQEIVELEKIPETAEIIAEVVEEVSESVEEVSEAIQEVAESIQEAAESIQEAAESTSAESIKAVAEAVDEISEAAVEVADIVVETAEAFQEQIIESVTEVSEVVQAEVGEELPTEVPVTVSEPLAEAQEVEKVETVTLDSSIEQVTSQDITICEEVTLVESNDLELQLDTVLSNEKIIENVLSKEPEMSNLADVVSEETIATIEPLNIEPEVVSEIVLENLVEETVAEIIPESLEIISEVEVVEVQPVDVEADIQGSIPENVPEDIDTQIQESVTEVVESEQNLTKTEVVEAEAKEIVPEVLESDACTSGVVENISTDAEFEPEVIEIVPQETEPQLEVVETVLEVIDVVSEITEAQPEVVETVSEVIEIVPEVQETQPEIVETVSESDQKIPEELVESDNTLPKEEDVTQDIVPMEQVVLDYPEVPPEIPYLIVGGGTAAYAAVRAIRKYDPAAKILILSSEDQAPYNRTPLSKEMWFTNSKNVENLSYEDFRGKERSIFLEKYDFYCTTKELQAREGYGGTALLLGATLEKLDPTDKRAILTNGSEIKYEKCLLATGGKPKSLAVIDQADASIKENVTMFRHVNDFWKLEKLSRGTGDLVIVGSGFLGAELAYALGERSKENTNLKVSQICRESGVLGAVLPRHLSEYASEAIEASGVDVVRNAEIGSVTKDNEKININLTDGRKVEADHVVLAVGLDIDPSIAIKSGLEHDPHRGGFIVNSELESRRDIYVAGDAANFYDIRLGRRRVEHYDHAIVTGRLAGENMTGKRKAYSHQSMFWSDIGANIGFEAMGLVDSRLKSVSVFAQHDNVDVVKNDDVNKNQYDKGVVFYLRNDVVVGVVTWNIFGKMGVARRLIAMESAETDYAELAKLFNVNKI